MARLYALTTSKTYNPVYESSLQHKHALQDIFVKLLELSVLVLLTEKLMSAESYL